MLPDETLLWALLSQYSNKILEIKFYSLDINSTYKLSNFSLASSFTE